jgi:hypothetical protein
MAADARLWTVLAAREITQGCRFGVRLEHPLPPHADLLPE